MNCDEIVESLSGTETDILHLMRLAEETVKELHEIPDGCNYEKIEAMNKAYLLLIRKIQEKMKDASKILLSQDTDE